MTFHKIQNAVNKFTLSEKRSQIKEFFERHEIPISNQLLGEFIETDLSLRCFITKLNYVILTKIPDNHFSLDHYVDEVFEEILDSFLIIAKKGVNECLYK